MCRCAAEVAQLHEAVLLLQELLEKERQAHMQELRVLNDTVTRIALQKDAQLAAAEQALAPLTRKLDQYKQRNAKLAERVKAHADTIAAMTERQAKFEAEAVRNRDTLDRERTRRAEEAQTAAELRTTVTMQEVRNKELVRQNQLLTEEVALLQREMSACAELRGKLSNIDQIAEDQYQHHISLLKTSLQQELATKTQELFAGLACRDNREYTQEKEGRQERETNAAEEELRTLSSFVDYGRTYFELSNQSLSLPESKKVFGFIARLSLELDRTESHLQEERQNTLTLSAQLRHTLNCLEEELSSLKQRKLSHAETQTDCARVGELAGAMSGLRLKQYELLKVVAFLSRFAVFAMASAATQATKLPYFYFAESLAFRSLKPRRRSMRPCALAVLFLQALSRGARRRRLLGREERFQRDALGKYVENRQLVELLHRFAARERTRIARRNHRIEEFAQQRPEADPHQAIIQILQQETLIGGPPSLDYSRPFARLIYAPRH